MSIQFNRKRENVFSRVPLLLVYRFNLPGRWWWVCNSKVGSLEPRSSTLPSAERPEDDDGAGLRGASEGSCRAAFPGKAAGRPH